MTLKEVAAGMSQYKVTKEKDKHTILQRPLKFIDLLYHQIQISTLNRLATISSTMNKIQDISQPLSNKACLQGTNKTRGR